MLTVECAAWSTAMREWLLQRRLSQPLLVAEMTRSESQPSVMPLKTTVVPSMRQLCLRLTLKASSFPDKPGFFKEHTFSTFSNPKGETNVKKTDTDKQPADVTTKNSVENKFVHLREVLWAEILTCSLLLNEVLA